jgi:hypothetical protein
LLKLLDQLFDPFIFSHAHRLKLDLLQPLLLIK